MLCRKQNIILKKEKMTMNIKKIVAVAAAATMALGVCTGVPMGTGNAPPLAITASANKVSANFSTDDKMPKTITATGKEEAITVVWTMVEGASSYEIIVSEVGNFSNQIDKKNVEIYTTCTFENIPAGEYDVWLKADNSDMYAVVSGVVVTTSTKTEEKESNKLFPFDVKLYDDKTVDVTWKELDGAYFYAIQVYFYSDLGEYDEKNSIFAFVSPNAKKDFKSGDLSVKAISGTKYTIDISAMPKNGYAYIYVIPADKDNLSIAAVEPLCTANLKANKRSTASPSSNAAAPSNIKSSKTSSSVTLSWDAVEGADMYRVYKYNEKTGKYEKYKDVKSTKCTVTGLKANTKYKFKITAYDKVNGKYVKGESSKPVSVTTKKK